MKKAVITAMGIVCSAGNNIDEFFKSLSNPNIDNTITKLDERGLNPDFDVLTAYVNSEGFNVDIDKKYDSGTNRLCLKSAKETVSNHEKVLDEIGLDAIVVGSSTGGQMVIENYVFDLLNGKDTQNINYVTQCNISSISRIIADTLNFDGKMLSVSTACTSTTNAIAIATSLIETSEADCVLVGGGDALCHTTLSGFRSLQLTGETRCTPFGEGRLGMTIGEGAGFIILENKEKVINENRKYHAEIRGYAMNSDAYHMSAPSEDAEGAYNVMNQALQKAGLNPSDIDFINAHGTGTTLNDITESSAIKKLFNNTPTASIKGLTGHVLGGAGIIETIASVYSIKNKTAFENFNNYHCADDCNDIHLVGKGGMRFNKTPVVLSNNFAFGGNNCTLIFGGMD